MKIEILEPKGYCAGVTNAIKIALKAKEEHKNETVYILGMLVHNEQVISFLKQQGIHVVYEPKKSLLDLSKDIPEGSIVVFTAHGHEVQLDKVALDKKFVVYDAVCPRVKQNIELINKALQNGHQVIYIGFKNHPESLAAVSINKNVILYDMNDNFDFNQINDNEPLVLNQTTLNSLEIKDIQTEIKSHFPKALIMDEICNATRARQNAIVESEEDVDLIIVVGDKKSSNTNRLLEIAKSTKPNAESIMIASKDDISSTDLKRFKNKNHIIISSGASTPSESIDAIYNLIKNY